MARATPATRALPLRPLPLLVLPALLLLLLPSQAQADRASALFLGSDVRMRPERGPDAGGPVLELGVPLGLTSAGGRTKFVLRGGAVVPTAGGPLMLPATVGARVAPVGGRLRPVLGADLGGYLVRVSHADADMPAPAPWCWSLRALAGAALALGDRATVSLYADAMWVQTPREESARGPLGTTAGVGLEIHVSFAPRWRLVEMVLDGTTAPEGF